MDVAFQASRVLSISLFLYYGSACLFSQAMVTEFERFGLPRFRRLTGALEVLGALGLLAGYAIPVLVVAASLGLTLLMLLGIAARLRVRDPLLETMPALILMLVNLFICLYTAGLWPSSAGG